MLTEHIEAAMMTAHYEIAEEKEYFGTIPKLIGLCAKGKTLEECRQNLIDTLEDWLFIGIREKMKIPRINGVSISPNKELTKVNA